MRKITPGFSIGSKLKIALFILLLVPMLLATVPPQHVAASDDYPSRWRDVPMDSVFDDWGMYNRECVSFVAWRLHVRNGFEMPFHADASLWKARAQDLHYMVDSTPTPGAVAWSPTHVAWVESVDSPSNRVTIEDYNGVDSNGNGRYGDDGTYSERTVSSSMYQYIHFRDLPVGHFVSQAGQNYAARMVRHPNGTIAYVAVNGLRYWVPSMDVVNCLGGSANVTQLTADIYNSLSPSQFNANCLGRYNDRIVRAPDGTIAYVDTNGLKHWVPSMDVFNCLGANYTQIDSATYTSIPSGPQSANCLSGANNRLLRGPNGYIGYIDNNTIKHWVPSMDIVGCLGGVGSLAQVDSGTINALHESIQANCLAKFYARMIMSPNGTVGYVASDGVLHWVPNSATVSCLGAWGSVISVDVNTYSSWPQGATADCSSYMNY